LDGSSMNIEDLGLCTCLDQTRTLIAIRQQKQVEQGVLK